MTQTIKLRLTDDQMKQLEPLMNELAEHPQTGFVIGYVSELGYIEARFTTPREVKAMMEATIARITQK